MSAVTEVVGALIDAAFSTGGITDAQQVDLHAKLDGADQPAVPAEAAPDSVAPMAPEFGTESTPYV